MSRINQVPRGLQSLLRSKSLGANPSDLGQLVLPTVDLTNAYAAERMRWAQAIFNATAPQVEIDVGPDDGKLWLPTYVAGYASHAGTGPQDVRLLLRLLNPVNGPTSVVLASTEFRSIDAGDAVFVAWNWHGPQPYVFGGMRFQLRAIQAGNPEDVTASVVVGAVELSV